MSPPRVCPWEGNVSGVGGEDLDEAPGGLAYLGEGAGEADEKEDFGPGEAVIGIAEEPGLWLPAIPERTVFHGEGFSFVSHGRSAWVHRLRLSADQVSQRVDHSAAILSNKGLPEATWWVGELSTPDDLAERLVELGLEPDDPAEMTSMTIVERPAGEPEVEVRRVETLDDELQGLEIDWEAFDVPAEERELRRGEAEAAWRTIQADGRQSTFLAYLDDEPVGFGRLVTTPHGALLLGGATLPAARGKGVYTALVHARWREAVGRGVPRLAVAAGPASAPILLGLGFERIGTVRLFRQQADEA
jgi:GNAT superfamily N-acetyltransferase